MSIKNIPAIQRRHTLFHHLIQREELGAWFRTEDLPGARAGRLALTKALMPFMDNVMAQLLSSAPFCHQTFLSWERKYLTFEFFIHSSKSALEIKYRYIIYCIEDGLRCNNKEYIKRIRKQCCAGDEEISRLVSKIQFPARVDEPPEFSDSMVRLPLMNERKSFTGYMISVNNRRNLLKRLSLQSATISICILSPSTDAAILMSWLIF